MSREKLYYAHSPSPPQMTDLSVLKRVQYIYEKCLPFRIGTLYCFALGLMQQHFVLLPKPLHFLM